ncbi:MAG TPA: FAD-dependent thymidylate synthase [Thermomicrobiales bacterium]|nr:FAD-dependent thymidylate synthase [Thermomicrobiales bacterium]
MTTATLTEVESSPAYERVRVPELDAILGQQFKVLDDGFVRVVDYMGGDSSIVQAARVSYGAGTKKVREDRGLIRYLIRHQHTTPLEMCELKLHVRVPMDTWRQWVRHRTASVNEYSTRYSIAIDAAQQTPEDAWRGQSASNRQGSEGWIPTETGTKLTAREAELHRLSREIYDERLELGVAREQARKDLPLATYTEAYWKVNLHNLMHFLALRMDAHAQFEIREYASTIGNEIVSRWCPVAWEAFLDYNTNGLSFTTSELAIVQALTAGDVAAAIGEATQHGFITVKDGVTRVSREGKELGPKLARLGLTAPWE